ncbi:MAG: polysaccharide export outer membrane protein [Porticoccaceae bacterium]|jgi:polysaccharide export outer membrane protein
MNALRICTLFLIAALTACASSRGPLSEDERPPEITRSETPQFRLGTGDVINVSVWKNPDLSARVPVRPDGYVSLPLVGEVLAGGRTPMEIAQDTEQKLTQFIRTPKVSVIIEEIPSAEFQNRVRVVGGVAEPKSISHRDGMTVIDLVLEAGGVNEFASPNAAKLYRKIDGMAREFEIYLDDILSKGMLDTNYRLVPGDVITIPERRF